MSDRPLELIFGVNDTNPLDVTWGPWMFAGMDYRPARKRIDLVTSEDSDGALPLGQAKADNMVMGLRLRVDEGASMDAALDQMHRLQKKLDDAARRAPDGLECVWRPEGASERSTFFVLEGEIAESPQEMSGADIGWYHKSPILVVTLICKPFFYGDWSTPVVVNGTTPVIEAELENVGGDVDAEGEMTVTDLESVDRSHFEWGLEQYGYDPVAPEDVILNLASGLTVTGYAGTSTTESGSYSANTVEGTAYTSEGVAICATTGQTHIGCKRIKIRVKPSANSLRFRLAWRVGDGAFARGQWATIVDNSEWQELDLGVIDIQPLEIGTHRWEGRIEVSDADETQGTIADYKLDYVEVLPAERYGKIRAPYVSPVFDDIVGYDNFSLAVTNLTGDTATDGQVWASMGGLTDGADFQAAAGNAVSRQTVSDGADERYGRGVILGSGVAASTRVEATIEYDTAPIPSGSGTWSGVIARFVDNNNFICALVAPYDPEFVHVRVRAFVGGSIVTVVSGASAVDYRDPAGPHRIGLEVTSAGVVIAYLDGVEMKRGYNSILSPSGALASGKVGLIDHNPVGNSFLRTFSDFLALQGMPTAFICHADEGLLVTHDSAERYDSTGVHAATPPQVRGSYLWIPPSGDQDKTTRIVSKMRRNDVDAVPDGVIDDEHEMSIRYRPRYRAPIGQAA